MATYFPESEPYPHPFLRRLAKRAGTYTTPFLKAVIPENTIEMRATTKLFQKKNEKTKLSPRKISSW
jgi:hypothetical protein